MEEPTAWAGPHPVQHPPSGRGAGPQPWQPRSLEMPFVRRARWRAGRDEDENWVL